MSFAGKYRLEKNENMDDYYYKVGIPYLIRKALLYSTPTVDVVKSPDPESDWSITIHEAFKSVEMKFKYGQEFDEVLPMATFKTTATPISDNVIRFDSTSAKGELIRTFTFGEDNLALHLHQKTIGVEGKRYFKKIDG